MFAMYILLLCLVRVKLMLMMMKKINQQNIESFSVTGVICKLTRAQAD